MYLQHARAIGRMISTSKSGCKRGEALKAQTVRISETNSKYLYWNICQQIAHHTINGCNLQTGDLLASGTISGPTPDSLGSMLELAWKGTRPLTLGNGETRVFLQDGDRVTMKAWCARAGLPRRLRRGDGSWRDA